MSKTTTLDPVKQAVVTTGIAGLDEILCGGLPANQLYLIDGEPGTGKTTIALEFLLEGAKRGERLLYITLSETKQELEQVAKSHGWSLQGIDIFELGDLGERLQPQGQYTLFHPSEVELDATTERIYAEVERIQPQRVVFDSLSEIRLLARDPLRYRRHILAIKQFFKGRQSTVFLLDDRTSQADDLQLQSICHGVLLLETLINEHGNSPRRLRVMKLRGVPFQEGLHDFVIRRGRVLVFPRLIAADRRLDKAGAGFSGKNASSGLAKLDELVGGGILYGSSVLVMGPAGSGKSTIAMQYVKAACGRGERASCFLFEEGRQSFLRRAASLGMNFSELMDKDLLHIEQIDPAQITPGEFSDKVVKDVTQKRTSIVVIDSLNGYLNAMPNPKFLLIQLHELVSYLNDHGVLTFLVIAQHGLVGAAEAPVDISYLADSVILLRYFEAQGAVHKAISVVKKRSSGHEATIRELSVTEKGLSLGHPLETFHGVLTGTPTYTGGGKLPNEPVA